jgi:hypothetical protein
MQFLEVYFIAQTPLSFHLPVGGEGFAMEIWGVWAQGTQTYLAVNHITRRQNLEAECYTSQGQSSVSL